MLGKLLGRTPLPIEEDDLEQFEFLDVIFFFKIKFSEEEGNIRINVLV